MSTYGRTIDSVQHIVQVLVQSLDIPPENGGVHKRQVCFSCAGMTSWELVWSLKFKNGNWVLGLLPCSHCGGGGSLRILHH